MMSPEILWLSFGNKIKKFVETDYTTALWVNLPYLTLNFTGFMVQAKIT